MKQILYTDEQKKFLEILANVEKVFAPKGTDESREYHKKIKELKEMYGIKEKYQTLREYLKEHSVGAYHSFYFTIEDVTMVANGIEEFVRIYNESLLDKYYVIRDTTQEHGNNCENYHCQHFLWVVPKED